jgi:transposase
MAAPIRLREDLSSVEVRAFARNSKDAGQVRRLLAIARILDGGSRSEAAGIAGVTLQIIRDWVLRYNEGGVAGLATRKAPGPRTILHDGHRHALAKVIETGPIAAVHGVVRWRIIDLVQWLWDEFEVSISKQALGHELRTMGYRKLTARPHHRGQQPDDIAVFKKSSAPVWRKSARPSPKGRAWTCGGRMKPGSASRPSSLGDRPSSLGDGPGVVRGLQRPRTSDDPRHGCSARSVPLKERPPASSCPGATVRR